ncbi:MAG: transcriptional repressor [Deltaproteobacteria bacterium]|nr:transcriptional repressor [Deltaproteobacteria bacterium]
MKDIKRRNTRQRAVVFNVLRHTRQHPDAEWIYKEARKIIPNLSLGTIYRNLKILKEQGKIVEVKSEYSQSARFCTLLTPHSHFHCQRCDSVSDVHGLNEKDIFPREQMDQFGEVRSVQIVFHGNCSECLKKNDISLQQA